MLTTSSDVLIRCAYNDLPVTYKKGEKPAKVKYNIKTAVESDCRGFGNRVGVYSNWSTNYFAMLPLFEGNDKQEIFKGIKALRYIIGQEIDSTKNGIKPKAGSQFYIDKITYDILANKSQLTPEEQKQIEDNKKVNELKKQHNKFVPAFKPYFTVNLDDKNKNKFTKYKTYMTKVCQKFMFMTLDKLLVIPDIEMTSEQKEFKQMYIDNSPLLLTDCVLNKICWNLEKFENEIMKPNFKVTDENYILLGYADSNVKIKKSEKIKIVKIFERYTNGIATMTRKMRCTYEFDGNNDEQKENMTQYKKSMRTEALKELYGICSNSKRLFDLIVKALEDEKKKSVNKFIWNVLSYDLLDVIKNEGEV